MYDAYIRSIDCCFCIWCTRHVNKLCAPHFHLCNRINGEDALHLIFVTLRKFILIFYGIAYTFGCSVNPWKFNFETQFVMTNLSFRQFLVVNATDTICALQYKIADSSNG